MLAAAALPIPFIALSQPISQIVDFPRRPQNEQPRDAAQEIAEKLQREDPALFAELMQFLQSQR